MVAQRCRRFGMGRQISFNVAIGKRLKLDVASVFGQSAISAKDGAGQQKNTFDMHDFLDLQRRFIQTDVRLQGLRRMLLATKDAHELYRRFSFTELANPSRMMEIVYPNIYNAT